MSIRLLLPNFQYASLFRRSKRNHHMDVGPFRAILSQKVNCIINLLIDSSSFERQQRAAAFE